MTTPLLLDLFAGAGGAGAGYARAGFCVVGCDLDPKPLRHNPYECYQGDALAVLDTLLAGGEWHGYRLGDFAAIHASPPCQDYSAGNKWGVPGRERKRHPRLIAPVQERLIRSGLPYILENVRMALAEMRNPVLLCGTMFGLRVQRHRLFDSNVLLFAAGECNHRPMDVSVRCHRTEYLGIGTPHTCANGVVRIRNAHCPIGEARKAMGVDWMPSEELGEAIPPAYTAWLGSQLINAIGGMAA